MPLQRLALILALATPPAACLSTTDPGVGIGDPEPDPAATTRILFVGNSLTYVNDVPNMVKALADSAHIAGVQTADVSKPDYALEDHWSDGQARRVIEKGGWHYVVMQQGPSSRPENRANLRQWAATFADLIKSKQGTPAMYQVWPALPNFSDFDNASESYRLAAQDIQGPLLPAGEAWRAAWRRDGTLALYSSDGLHASANGSFLAALTIFGGLWHRSVVGLATGITVPGGSVTYPASVALLFQRAADEANGITGPP